MYIIYARVKYTLSIRKIVYDLIFWHKLSLNQQLKHTIKFNIAV